MNATFGNSTLGIEPEWVSRVAQVHIQASDF